MVDNVQWTLYTIAIVHWTYLSCPVDIPQQQSRQPSPGKALTHQLELRSGVIFKEHERRNKKVLKRWAEKRDTGVCNVHTKLWSQWPSGDFVSRKPMTHDISSFGCTPVHLGPASWAESSLILTEVKWRLHWNSVTLPKQLEKLFCRTRLVGDLKCEL